ncbi:hypothetical protein Scep_024085 [Stephania cephalantha]|uniref:Uncharacterized protein n=1 Tax=Stephania cephalantha TaxID=152367 RepID=A0AAP0EYN4_9MAGN
MRLGPEDLAVKLRKDQTENRGSRERICRVEASDGEARLRWRREAAMETRGSVEANDGGAQTTEREKESERDFAMRERGEEEEKKSLQKFLVEARRWRRISTYIGLGEKSPKVIQIHKSTKFLNKLNTPYF